MRWPTACLFIVALCKSASGYFITVDAHAEECFFDSVEQDTKMALTFEIAEGGFLDIDVKVVDPEGKVLFTAEQESSGKYMFSAETPGIYTYCFSNQKSTMTPKVVMFNMDILHAPNRSNGNPVEGEETQDGKDQGKLDDMIKELSTSLWGVKNEQEYMQVRDRNHRAINESTNSRVVIWSFFEALVLVTMTIGQIFYLKRFFEVRRVV